MKSETQTIYRVTWTGVLSGKDRVQAFLTYAEAIAYADILDRNYMFGEPRIEKVTSATGGIPVLNRKGAQC